jgi:hypothetical protein
MEVRSSLFIFQIIDEYNNIPSYSSDFFIVFFIDFFIFFDLAHLHYCILEIGRSSRWLFENELE